MLYHQPPSRPQNSAGSYQPSVAKGVAGPCSALPWRAAASAMYQLLAAPSILAEEFKKLHILDQASSQSMEEAMKPENLHRNRYRNVLPYDANRVQLQSPHNYINASQVEIHSQGLPPCRYICTQAPLDETTSDFWEMVWLNAVPAIVMLSTQAEIRADKCSTYFPTEQGTHTITGEYSILNRKTVQLTADIECRQLALTSTRTGATRNVFHLSYSSWPDNGVPPDTQGVRVLSGLLQPWKRQQRTIAVHCSAGIGRTGTFCAVDVALHRLRSLPSSVATAADAQWQLDLPAIVYQLRQQRMGMVQTSQQYAYCYLTLLEAAQHLADQAMAKEKLPRSC